MASTPRYDKAHKWTDEQLEQLERRMGREYAQAAREMRGKQAKWLEKFDKERSQRERAMDDTPEARKAHKEWLAGQAKRSEWLDSMSSQLAESANNANVKAAGMLNDSLPTIFAENANRAAFAIDSELGIDTAFALVDEDTVRILMALRTEGTQPRQLIRETVWFQEEEGQIQSVRKRLKEVRGRKVDYAKDIRWNRQKFTSAITQGILQGESVPHIVKRTESIFGQNMSAAYRAARTACTAAECAGRICSYERAESLGIEMVQEWMATMDAHTRDSHRALDGQQVAVGEPFESEHGPIDYPGDPAADPAETYNCFIGETLAVPLGGIERSYRRLYEGYAVTVRTSRGVEFTCTPNHPVLTSEGWVRAGELCDGDSLLVARIGNGLIPGANPDVEHIGTRMDAIHELAAACPSERAAGLDVYFHEDVPARNVDVVTEERVLAIDFETMGLEQRSELRFEHPDSAGPRHSSLAPLADAPATAPDGLVGGCSEPGALLWGSVRHALEHGLGAVPGRDSSPLEPERHSTATDAQLFRESLDALTATVLLDDVASVDVQFISCHVYNLQTESGAYLATGNDNERLYAICHNCRCTVRGRVKGFEGKTPARWSNLPSDVTYEEWKEGKSFLGEALTYAERFGNG